MKTRALAARLRSPLLLIWVAVAAFSAVSPGFATEPHATPESAACAEALRFRFGWELELTPAQYSLLMTEIDLDFFDSNYPWEVAHGHDAFDLILATYLTHSNGLDAIRARDPQLYATLEKRFGLNEKLLIDTRTGVLRPEPAPLPKEFADTRPPSTGLFSGIGVLMPSGAPRAPEPSARPRILLPGSERADAAERDLSAGKIVETDSGLLTTARGKREGIDNWWQNLPREEKLRFFDVHYLSRAALAELVRFTWDFKTPIPFWRWKEDAPEWLKRISVLHDGHGIVEFTLDDEQPVHERELAVSLLKNLAKRTGTHRALFEVETLVHRGTVPLHWHTSVAGFQGTEEDFEKITERVKLLEGLEDVQRWGTWTIMTPKSEQPFRPVNYVDQELRTKGNVRLVSPFRMEERELSLDPDSNSRRLTRLLSLPPGEAIQELESTIARHLSTTMLDGLYRINPALWVRYVGFLENPEPEIAGKLKNPLPESMDVDARLTFWAGLYLQGRGGAAAATPIVEELRNAPVATTLEWSSWLLDKAPEVIFENRSAFERLQAAMEEAPYSLSSSGWITLDERIARNSERLLTSDADRAWFQEILWSQGNSRYLPIPEVPVLAAWLLQHPIRHGAVSTSILGSTSAYSALPWLEFLATDRLVLDDAVLIFGMHRRDSRSVGWGASRFLLSERAIAAGSIEVIELGQSYFRRKNARNVADDLAGLAAAARFLHELDASIATAPSTEEEAHALVVRLQERTLTTQGARHYLTNSWIYETMLYRLSTRAAAISSSDFASLVQLAYDPRTPGVHQHDLTQWLKKDILGAPSRLQTLLSATLKTPEANSARRDLVRGALIRAPFYQAISVESLRLLKAWSIANEDAEMLKLISGRRELQGIDDAA